jgi:hypothetical protein
LFWIVKMKMWHSLKNKNIFHLLSSSNCKNKTKQTFLLFSFFFFKDNFHDIQDFNFLWNQISQKRAKS